ncbi:hypothetical protein GOP47_0017147, partial [Adiantum capillus-veneris]
ARARAIGSGNNLNRRGRARQGGFSDCQGFGGGEGLHNKKAFAQLGLGNKSKTKVTDNMVRKIPGQPRNGRLGVPMLSSEQRRLLKGRLLWHESSPLLELGEPIVFTF